MSYAQQAMDKTKEAASKATDAAMTATGAAGEATPEAEEDKEKKAAEATDDNQASLLEQTKKTMTDPKAMAAASKDAAMASFNRGKAMVQDAFSDNRLNMILQNMSGVPMFCILIVFFRLRAK